MPSLSKVSGKSRILLTIIIVKFNDVKLSSIADMS